MADILKVQEQEAQWEITTDEPLTFEAKAQRCRERIETGYRNMNVGFYDVAVAMAEAMENDYFSLWGYKNLEEYADAVLGIERRKAYNMVECGRAIKASPILTRERVEKIGWSKLALVARRIELQPASAEKYLDLAEKSSFRELRAAMAALLAGKSLEAPPEGGSEPFVLRSVRLDGEAAKIVQDALNLAMEQLQTQSQGEALNRICADWLLLQNESADVPLDAWIAYIKSQYGVWLQPVSESDTVPRLMLRREAIVSSEEDVERIVEDYVEEETLSEDDEDDLEHLFS